MGSSACWSTLHHSQTRQEQDAEVKGCVSLSGLEELMVVVAPPSGCSGIHKGHGDVADASGGGQALVVVGEPARVHEGPAFAWRLDGAVVAQEPAAAALQAADGSAMLVWLQRGNECTEQLH